MNYPCNTRKCKNFLKSIRSNPADPSPADCSQCEDEGPMREYNESRPMCPVDDE